MSGAVRIEPRSMADALNFLKAYKSNSNRALQRSINLGAKQGQKASVDEMNKKANLTKTVIRSHTKMYFSSISSLQAKLVIKGEPIPLTSYGAKQTNTGITFRIWKTGTREKYKHAFFWTIVRERYTGIFEPNVDHPRFDGFGPYRRKSGPGIPTIYENTPGLAGKAEEIAAAAMLKELDRQIGLINKGY